MMHAFVTTRRFLVFPFVVFLLEPAVSLIGTAVFSTSPFAEAMAIYTEYYLPSLFGMIGGNLVVLLFLAAVQPGLKDPSWHRTVFVIECVAGALGSWFLHIGFFASVAYDYSSTEGIAIVMAPILVLCFLMLLHFLLYNTIVLFTN